MRTKYFLILLLVVATIFLPLNTFGANNVNININTRDDLSINELEGRKLRIWKINPNFIDTSLDKSRLINILEDFSFDDLDKQVEDESQKWIENPKKENNYSIKLNDLETGLYYIREEGGEKRRYYLLPAIFSPKETNIVNLKWGKRKNPPRNPKDPPSPPSPPPNVPPSPKIPRNSVELLKTDEEGNILAGVQFSLHFSNGESVKTKLGNLDESGSVEILKTDENGKILIKDLKPGVYFFKEEKPLKGYEILEKESYFHIFEGQGTSLHIKNRKKKGSISFFKSDEGGENPLQGARFVITKIVDGKHERLKNEAGDIVLTSDEEGRFEISNLDYGTYYLWEIKPPQGYNLLRGSVKFEIDETSQTKIIRIKNNKRPPIPSTGDITFLILALAGSLMIILGIYLLKTNKEDSFRKE